MLAPHEVNVKLFELLNKDHKLKTKTLKHAQLLRDFVLDVDQVTGCMLIALIDPETVSLMVKGNGKAVSELLDRICRAFTRVHTIPTVYKMLYVRYKQSANMLPLEMQRYFNNYIASYSN